MTAGNGNHDTDAANGQHATIGRGTGCTIQELKRQINGYFKRKGFNVFQKTDSRHLWRAKLLPRRKPEKKAATSLPEELFAREPYTSLVEDLWRGM